KPDQRSLRAAVDRKPAVARETDNGCHVDDSSFAVCHHGANDVLRQDDWRKRVHANELFDLRIRHEGEDAIESKRGIVDESIHRAELLAYGLDHSWNLFYFGKVEWPELQRPRM